MILDDIIAKQKERIEQDKKIKSLDIIKKEIENNFVLEQQQFIFKNSLMNKKFSFICEIKKASPSKGIIADDFPYLGIAKQYEQSGASAISVLTEPNFFKGNDRYLKEISKNVKIPVLRKDFIIDQYQIYQAKIIGASAILLICAVLDEKTLNNFLSMATNLKLDCLVEVHNEEEIKKAVNVGALIIGINNRNLKTFTVDINTSLKLKKYVPKDKILISESGIKNSQDIKILKNAGFNGVLIGESIMLSKDKKQFLMKLQELEA